MKKHDANAMTMYENSVGLLPKLVAKSHSGTLHIDFSDQEEMEASWQESLYQAYKATDD